MLPHRDPKSRRIMYCDLTLSSIRTSGTSVSQTGLALNTFVQTGAAGEPFAFPIVLAGKKLTLDPSFLQYLPVTHSMITNTSLSILSGLHEFGFPIEEHKKLDPSNPVVRLHRPGALF